MPHKNDQALLATFAAMCESRPCTFYDHPIVAMTASKGTVGTAYYDISGRYHLYLFYNHKISYSLLKRNGTYV
jgi:hypothetical protein